MLLSKWFYAFQVEQLADHTGEESVILTASVSDGSLSHLGSESGKVFLEDHDDIKSQFLGFCLKRKWQSSSKSRIFFSFFFFQSKSIDILFSISEKVGSVFSWPLWKFKKNYSRYHNIMTLLVKVF